MKTYSIMTFRFQCRSCTHGFDGPLLPDMESYGYFLVSRTKGRNAIVQTIAHKVNEKAWEEIQQLSCKVANSVLQRLYCACLDPLDGEIWEMDFICPKCESRDISFGDSKPAKLREIEMLSFSDFNALGEKGKREYIKKVLPKVTALAEDSQERDERYSAAVKR